MNHQQHQHHHEAPTNKMALSATLHCLAGCAIGEVLGLMIGTAIGLSTGLTIALAVSLAFLFGYALSILPLVKSGLSPQAALKLVLAADTLSIATMELVDNLVMASVPGAMDAGLVNSLFWISMTVALAVAFMAAYPVNRWLLGKGKGHALLHEYHHTHEAPQGWRKYIPSLSTGTLITGIVMFMVGGLVVSLADEQADPDSQTVESSHS